VGRSRPCVEPLESRLAPAAHDTLNTAVPLTFDADQKAQVPGTLADPNQVDLYQVRLNSGDELTAVVQSASFDNPVNSYLRIFDASGEQLDTNDNQLIGGIPLTYEVQAVGLY